MATFGLARLKRPLARLAERINYDLCQVVLRERHAGRRLPLPVKIALWRQGFLTESHAVYDLARNDPRDYLPDFARHFRGRNINGVYTPVLSNKLVFDWMLRAHWPERLPQVHGLLVRDGELLLSESGERVKLLHWFDELGPGARVVLKPLDRSVGIGFRLLERSGGGYRLNGQEAVADDLCRELDELRNYLVSECIEAHAYSRELFPDAVNSIRLLTIWDLELDEPFLAAAVQRIGTRRSAPVDNWERGGLSARIDPATGALGPAVGYPRPTLEWLDRHPDTGAPISGAVIPDWAWMRDELLSIARRCPWLPYVGWDLVRTPDGFRVLEGNHNSGVVSIQVHGPLLTDPRVRRFYQAHGVIR